MQTGQVSNALTNSPGVLEMQARLAPLKKRLQAERLLEDDWDDIMVSLDAIRAKMSLKAQTTVDDVINGVYGQPMGPALIDDIVKGEERRAKIKEAAKNLQMSRLIIDFLKGNLFFLEVSRWIKKIPATHWKGFPNPTAMMAYDTETDDFVMLYNINFFAAFVVDHGEAEGEKMIQFIIAHELYHFTLKHITVRRRTPAFAWNIGTDAAINSLNVKAGLTLPPCGIYPTRKWESPPFHLELRKGKLRREMTPEEKKMMEGIGELIEGWPTLNTSEWYFNDLMQWAKDNGHTVTDRGIKVKGTGLPGDGSGEPDDESDLFDQMDSHDMWDKVPEETRERITEKVRSIMKNAARRADNESNGWGNIPADLQKDIRSFIDNRVDWRELVSNFVGSFTRGDRIKSMKRINRKYPYIHAGHRRDHLPRILVLCDASGSVSDAHFELAFGCLGSLAKMVSFTVAVFDTDIRQDDVFEWRKGQPCPKPKRTKCGGTDFKAALDWANDSERRSRWDGIIVVTDGECCDPGPSRLRKAWLIVPGHKLLFKSSDLVVQMDDETSAKKSGAIR